MTIEEFSKAFQELKQKGFVPSVRSGPTGIGKTLEDLVGLPENNLALPDLGEIELKSHRGNSAALITIFTMNREVWLLDPLEACRKYGTADRREEQNGRMNLYFTLSTQRRTKTGLGLEITNDSVSVKHFPSGEVVAQWTLASIQEQFAQKVPALLLVTALSQIRGSIEWFHYTRAVLFEHPFAECLAPLLSTGTAKIDLRIHERGTSARNHGTGFRTAERHLTKFFRSARDL